jgi:hypothetical protein
MGGEAMQTTTAKFRLTDDEQEMVDHLCTEFEPGQFLPPWMAERGEPADWEAWMRVERHELRDNLEVAVLVGAELEHIGFPWTGDPGQSWAQKAEARLALFHTLVDRLVPVRDNADLDGIKRVQEHFTIQECDRLSDLMNDACEAACRRALRVDRGPRAVAGS